MTSAETIDGQPVRPSGPERVGLGAMRLSTVDIDRAAETLRAAVAAGITLVDTADVYGVSDQDRHGNERWLASILPNGVEIATKGGLVRGPKRWRPDGRAKSIRAACEGSRRALGRAQIDLYQLHAPDPRTSLATSARALARLVADGWVRRVGLCNVGVDQVRQVERYLQVSAVQVALSPFDGTAIRSGVVEYCQAHGIEVLAHSPFGGPKRAARIGRDPVLTRIADAHGVRPHAVVLAWLRDLGVVPLAGPTQPEHVAELAAAMRMALTDRDRETLDERFPLGVWLRTPRARRRPPPKADNEVVLLMGIQAAGKTTAVEAFVARGYTRFNRDEIGGSLARLHRKLDAFLAGSGGPVVLDNTYPTRASRHEVLEVAWRHGRSVRCIWLDTPLPAAQLNAVQRMWQTFGRLLDPVEVRAAAAQHPNVFGPQVQTRFQHSLEVPAEEEGFSAVERRAFCARPWPDGRSGTIVSDDLLDELGNNAGLAAVVFRQPGPLAVVAWWPTLSHGAREARIAAWRRWAAAAQRTVAVFSCVHAADAGCWCLLPLPGLGVAAIATLDLDPDRSVWVGTGPVHRRAAERFGMRYLPAEQAVPVDRADD